MANFLTHFFIGETELRMSDTDFQRAAYEVIPLNEALLQSYLAEAKVALPALLNKKKDKTKEKITNKFKGNLPFQISQDYLQNNFKGKILEFRWLQNQHIKYLSKNLLNYKLRIVHPKENLEVVYEKYQEYFSTIAANLEEEEKEEERKEEGREQQHPQFEYIDQGEADFEQEQEQEQDQENQMEIVSRASSPINFCNHCLVKDQRIEDLEKQVLGQKEIIEGNDQSLSKLKQMVIDVEKKFEAEKRLYQRTLEFHAEEKKILLEAHQEKPSPAGKRKVAKDSQNRRRERPKGINPVRLNALFKRWKAEMLKEKCDVLYAKESIRAAESPEVLGHVEDLFKDELAQIEEQLRTEGKLLKVFQNEEIVTKRKKVY